MYLKERNIKTFIHKVRRTTNRWQEFLVSRHYNSPHVVVRVFWSDVHLPWEASGDIPVQSIWNHQLRIEDERDSSI
jgi:hypothetical protein